MKQTKLIEGNYYEIESLAKVDAFYEDFLRGEFKNQKVRFITTNIQRLAILEFSDGKVYSFLNLQGFKLKKAK